ncbi:EKC/KEOPS complex, subunit Gon7 [Rhexocercosporidium sp. MPI-PUGE-AT-0058]|nr:EKC/KEOPS complex, subunit Gon7 [Rhexocercosporidium sp. MPI-PUGE-AT-0058]
MASPAPTSTTTTPTLKATYSSPTNAPFTYSTTLPSLPSLPSHLESSTTSTASKTAYLSALRHATSQMQENINKELTARMEEDNKVAATAASAEGKGKGKGGGKVDEKKEEENYGEEVVEED